MITYQHITMAEAVFLRELDRWPVRPFAESREMVEVTVKVFTSETSATVFSTLVRADESLVEFREEVQREAQRLKATIESRLRADVEKAGLLAHLEASPTRETP